MDVALRPRSGTLADADEVVRLRRLMFVEMGATHDETWVPRAIQSYRSGLRERSLIAMVVDDPGGQGLVAGGIATFSPTLPGPGVHGAVKAVVSSMSTDRAWRRRGLARLVLAALLEEVDARGDIAWTELLGTEDGIGLYTSVGFAPHEHLTLRRPPPDLPTIDAGDAPTEELPIIG